MTEKKSVPTPLAWRWIRWLFYLVKVLGVVMAGSLGCGFWILRRLALIDER